MTVDPEDEQVAAAFASLKAESSAHFPPPPVNELLGRGPAVLRRRRLVSLAAIVGACTAVTAGGFAVAQTIGPLADGPKHADSGPESVASSAEDESTSFSIGDPASPESNEGETPTDDATVPTTTLVIAPPSEYDDPCATESLELNLEDWTFTDETPWRIAFDPDDPSGAIGPKFGDVDGEGEDDLVAVLECYTPGTDEKFSVSVVAFKWNEDGTALEQLGWAWASYSPTSLAEVPSVKDGVVTVETETPDPAFTGVFRYEWDAIAGSFVRVEDDATADPTPDESSSSPAPAETPTLDGTTGTTPSGS